jgi:hypothetical protein
LEVQFLSLYLGYLQFWTFIRCMIRLMSCNPVILILFTL